MTSAAMLKRTTATAAQWPAAPPGVTTELSRERARLRREIHDILAHTLGAVSVQLTALDSCVAAGDAPADVRERISDMHRLVRDGLGEARDAVRSLREPAPPSHAGSDSSATCTAPVLLSTGRLAIWTPT